MAIDEALLAEIARPLLRIYRWSRPSMSFGYFEKWEPVQTAHPQRELVRRWTGGGIVPHGDDITYSLLVPKQHAFFQINAAESYCAIHASLAGTLSKLGFPAVVAGNNKEKISQSCFENPVRYDVLLNMSKIAGAAQRRTQRGLLHQGSIQNIPPVPRFASSFAAAIAGNVSQFEMPARISEAAVELAKKKYGAESWLQKF